MSVLVVGMSHRSAPVSLLEQLSMDDDAAIRVASTLITRPSLTEALIVSTCNRVEVYCVTSSFHAGVHEVVDVLHEYSGVDIDTLRAKLYVRYADAAAEHMLMVTAGLDSMVVGEQQIIGQVRHAYQLASKSATAGPALHSLTQTALHTGKRVHTETAIDEAGASMVSFALQQAVAEMGREEEGLPLKGVSVLVLGAGAMASLASTHVGRMGVERLIVSNRTYERAQNLVAHALEAGVNAQAIRYEDRASVLNEVSMVVSATGADGFTINASDIPADHPGLVAVDLSLPRDLDDAIDECAGCHLINIEKLHEHADGETSQVHAESLRIVRDALEQFTSQQRVREVAPAVSALRKHAAELVEAEMGQLLRRTPGMEDTDRNEVNRTVRRIVDKLLHQPTVRVKQLAARSGTVTYETVIQELFGLQDPVLGRSIAVAMDELPGNMGHMPVRAESVAETYPSTLSVSE
ncbi:glutamyl-tRNA reductase [Corynebacterium sp. 11A]|uniref:glutamyl-tRNA reductase n=1 Tax=Corynebacterium sp. 11A TaxID=2080510 RepID=UPI00124DEFDE|nr:glutamyl-tRNA reductase [Corynebacterium sp. 11A]